MASQGPYTAAVPSPDGSATVDYTDSFTDYVVAVAQDFGFTIPAGATITDISVEFLNASGFTDDFGPNGYLTLSKDGFSSVGAEGSVIVGGGWIAEGSGLWATTWTPAEVNAVTFGVLIGGHAGFVASPPYTSSEGGVRVTVTYTPFVPPVVGAAPLSPVTMIGLGRRA